jgi:hypothetical protein
LVLAEVAGAISRTRHDPVRAEAFATTLGRPPNVTVVALDVALGDHARALAAQQALISLNHEHLTRLGSIVTVHTPAAALAELILPTPPSSAV